MASPTAPTPRATEMTTTIDEPIRRQGRLPHELAMVNLLVFNLMLCGGLLAGTMARKGSWLEQHRAWLVALPLAASLAVMAYSRRRARHAAATSPAFVAAHWRSTVGRYRFLLGAYGVSAALIGLGWLAAYSNPSLHDILFVALVRVAVAPLLISVMVIAVLESSALFQANLGEAPAIKAPIAPPREDAAPPA